MRKVVFGILLLVLSVGRVSAETIEVTDLAGRTVVIERPVERFVVSEGRYITALTLLRPDDPTAGLVGTMSPLDWTHPEFAARLQGRFPAARDIPLFGRTSADSVSVEQIIDLNPQVAIFGLGDHGPSAENAEIVGQLAKAGIKVVFIDFRRDPLERTLPSIALLGRVLGAEVRAAAYADFYRTRWQEIARRAGEAETTPSVFLQVHAGRFDCCWGMAEGMLGPFVGVAGGRNISDASAPGPTTQHTAEFLLTQDPDVWIGTASGTAREYRDGAAPVALGAGITPEMAADSLRRYLSKPAFQALGAIRNGRAHAIWHGFYNSPFNIVALEAFARWIHPELFADIHPQATFDRIQDVFLPVRLGGTYMVTLTDD